MSGGVRSTDRGYDALMKRVFGFGHPQVAMGLLEKDGAKAKEPWPEGEEGEEGLQLIDVANWMEFGVTITHKDGSEEDIPARSFIRAWFDEAQPELRRKFVVLMRGVVMTPPLHTKHEVLELLGLLGQAGIQKRIADGIRPANAPATIARKGSSKPLIASGQLRSGISFAVWEHAR